MSLVLRPFKWFYHEFGIVSIYDTGRNAWLIILARTCRMFAYGTNSLILGAFRHRSRAAMSWPLRPFTFIQGFLGEKTPPATMSQMCIQVAMGKTDAAQQSSSRRSTTLITRLGSL